MAKEGSRASWTFMHEKGLVVVMAECARIPMYRCDNGWTKEGWQSISNKFSEMFPTARYTKPQMQEKDKELKACYKSIRDARNESGVGWNDALNMINAEEHTWEKLIKSNPKIRKFKKKPFPLYNNLAAIREGSIAIGNLNFTSLDQVEPTAGRTTSEQRSISASDGHEASSAQRSISGQSNHTIAVSSGMHLVGRSPFSSSLGCMENSEVQSMPSNTNSEEQADDGGKKRKQS